MRVEPLEAVPDSKLAAGLLPIRGGQERIDRDDLIVELHALSGRKNVRQAAKKRRLTDRFLVRKNARQREKGGDGVRFEGSELRLYVGIGVLKHAVPREGDGAAVPCMLSRRYKQLVHRPRRACSRFWQAEFHVGEGDVDVTLGFEPVALQPCRVSLESGRRLERVDLAAETVDERINRKR